MAGIAFVVTVAVAVAVGILTLCEAAYPYIRDDNINKLFKCLVQFQSLKLKK